MKTPEEYAEELVQVTPYEPDDGTYWLRFSGHRDSPPATGEANLYGNREDAEYDAAIHRRSIAGVIRQAIEDAHAAWMASVSGGISEDRLKEVARVVASDKGWYDGYLTQTGSVCSSDDILLRAYEDRRDLLAHIQHQAALIEDIAQLSSEYTEARERIRKSARTEGWSARLHAFMRRKQPVRRFLTTRAPFALTWNASWIPFCLCLIRHPDPANHSC